MKRVPLLSLQHNCTNLVNSTGPHIDKSNIASYYRCYCVLYYYGYGNDYEYGHSYKYNHNDYLPLFVCFTTYLAVNSSATTTGDCLE